MRYSPYMLTEHHSSAGVLPVNWLFITYLDDPDNCALT